MDSANPLSDKVPRVHGTIPVTGAQAKIYREGSCNTLNELMKFLLNLMSCL